MLAFQLLPFSGPAMLNPLDVELLKTNFPAKKLISVLFVGFSEICQYWLGNIHCCSL